MTRTQIGTADVENGVAETTYTIPSGTAPGVNYTLYATYQENDNYMLAEGYAGAEIRIHTETTVEPLVIASKSTASETKYATLTAYVKYNTTQNVDAGTVQFQVGGANVGTPVAVSNGVATYQYQVPTNQETTTYTATFLETNTYGGSVAGTAGTLKIRDGTTVAITDLSGNLDTQVNIQVAITDINGENVSSGQAQLFVDDTAIGTAQTVSAGAVTFPYTIADNAILGNHTIRVEYAENDDYDAGVGTGTLIVRTPTVITAVDVSANAGATGVPIIVQIKDGNGVAIPSGTARITVGTDSAVEANVNASGEASITYDVPQNATGTIEFTAEYVENTNYQGSITANAGIITIRKGVTIVVDSVDAEIGDEITLSATVTDEDNQLVDEGTVVYELE